MRASSSLLALTALVSLLVWPVGSKQSSLTRWQQVASGDNLKPIIQLHSNVKPTPDYKTRLKRRAKTSNSLPHFSAPIGNVTAVLGRDVRLVCTVENLGQYQVAWLKEETKTIISIDTNIIITNYRIFLIPDEEERKWVLHIKDVQESDKGFYQCQVNTNPMRSTSGYLDVVVAPTIIEAQSSQVAEVAEHSNVSIQCKASGHPRPTISWRRDDGNPIRFSGRFNVTDQPASSLGPYESSLMASTQLNDVKSDKLSLYDVDRSMAGVYACTATNGIPATATKIIPLYVKFAPKTSVPDKYISVSLGDQFEVECLIEAFPKPNSDWSKKSTPQAHRSQLSRWLEATSEHRRALSLAPRQASLGLEPNPSFSNESLTIDGVSEPSRAVKSQFSRQSYPPQPLVTQHGNHRHNRIHFRHVDHHLVDSELADTLNNYRSPTLDTRDGLSLSSSVSARESKAYVTVKQTTINAYTYKLKMTIAKMQHVHYGEYSCISSNSMGSSESSVVVTRADKIDDDDIDSSKANSEENDYQKDSVKPYFRQQSGSHKSLAGNGRVVYDENYLQAIKNGQNIYAGSNRGLQQKLKSRQRNYAHRQTKASLITILFAICANIYTLSRVRLAPFGTVYTGITVGS